MFAFCNLFSLLDYAELEGETGELKILWNLS
jgi:hypothetical protein